jgi:hypothetical protein
VFVITADQQASRRLGDRVEDVLGALSRRAESRPELGTLALPFERTAGDEVQGLLTTAEFAVDLALHLQRMGGWSVGIGAGPVDRPLGRSSRASSGPAFVSARTAVERARSKASSVPLAVDGADPARAQDADAVLRLLAAVVRRRSAHGWEAIDAAAGRTQREAAAALGVTAQAVSQRLRTALWEEEVRARPVAARLLGQAAGDGDEGRA